MPSATVQVRVPFVDVDASQRIHFTAMFRYMEVAEHTLMRSLGFPYATALTDLAMPRVHLSCDFLGAVRFDDVIEVEAEVVHVGRSSWTVGFTARPTQAPAHHPSAAAEPVPAVLARGRMTIVVMNPETERSRPIPEPLRRALLNEPPAEAGA